MASASTTVEQPALSAREGTWIWLRHLTSLLLPLNSLVFLWTGPHSWYTGPLFMIPIGFAYAMDGGTRAERRQPVSTLPAWPFDALVYLLAALQFWTIVELARVFSIQGLFSIDMLLIFLVVGSSSGFSIITAHELIHRRRPWERQLGRLLLCTVLNEHFYTEHLRGHHVRVGLPEDPATARFGEPYETFYWRTIREQFRSAWKLESRRLGDPDMGLFDGRMLNNRILHGLAVGWGMGLAILASCGPVAFFAFLLQAFTASRLLEAVNYFEHWGLRRRTTRVAARDSWDTHAWFTYYGLIGLSRHADHHAEPARPYQQLRVRDDAPVLPTGYIGMVDMVIGKNEEFMRLARDELARRRLGPFAEDSDAKSTELPAPIEARGVRRAWQQIPLWLRRTLLFTGLLLASAAGVQWETSGDWSFADRLALHLCIAASFVAFFASHTLAARKIPSEAVTWSLAFGVLIALGRLTERLFA